MRDPKLKWSCQFLLICLTILLTSLTARAQQELLLEREFVGAVATSTVVSPDGDQQLLVDATVGQSIIGYQAGDIIITVGFQQTNLDGSEGGLGGYVEEENVNEAEVEADANAEIAVNAFPNPTVERLTIDLGPHAEKFTEVRLIDLSGKTVKRQLVSGDDNITFRELNRLPNANYFLQGIDTKGRLHQLSTVMIITY